MADTLVNGFFGMKEVHGTFGDMYSFMEHRVSDEEWNYGDVWGIENWQDMVQWEWPGKKNFGMDVVY